MLGTFFAVTSGYGWFVIYSKYFFGMVDLITLTRFTGGQTATLMSYRWDEPWVPADEVARVYSEIFKHLFVTDINICTRILIEAFCFHSGLRSTALNLFAIRYSLMVFRRIPFFPLCSFPAVILCVTMRP